MIFYDFLILFFLNRSKSNRIVVLAFNLVFSRSIVIHLIEFIRCLIVFSLGLLSLIYAVLRDADVV